MKHIIPAAIMFFLLISVSHAATERTVEYQIDGVVYEGFYIAASPTAPLVLLIHDWDGIDDYEIRRSRMLAELGYSVFAADMFGKGVRPQAMAERQQLTGALYSDRDKMRRLLQGALAAAAKEGADVGNVVAMGYCFGGAVILELARSGADLKGYVSFHGGLTTPEGQDYSATKGSVLVLHGTADVSVTMDHFATLAKELEGQGVTHEMITYSGAPHAFTVFGSDRYREDADRKSWDRFVRFLQEVFE